MIVKSQNSSGTGTHLVRVSEGTHTKEETVCSIQGDGCRVRLQMTQSVSDGYKIKRRDRARHMDVEWIWKGVVTGKM